MRIVLKILLSFVALIIAIPLFDVTKNVPVLKLTLLAGIVAAIAAIWKYNPEKNKTKNENSNDDKYKLDKK